jgi:hypothetical protein
LFEDSKPCTSGFTRNRDACPGALETPPRREQNPKKAVTTFAAARPREAAGVPIGDPLLPSHVVDAISR